MSDAGGYTANGTYVEFGIPRSADLLSGSIENFRRMNATSPAVVQAIAKVSDPIGDGLTEGLAGIAPDDVARVGLHVISLMGAQVVLGMHPVQALNIATYAVLKASGNLPDLSPP